MSSVERRIVILNLFAVSTNAALLICFCARLVIKDRLFALHFLHWFAAIGIVLILIGVGCLGLQMFFGPRRFWELQDRPWGIVLISLPTVIALRFLCII